MGITTGHLGTHTSTHCLRDAREQVLPVRIQPSPLPAVVYLPRTHGHAPRRTCLPRRSCRCASLYLVGTVRFLPCTTTQHPHTHFAHPPAFTIPLPLPYLHRTTPAAHALCCWHLPRTPAACCTAPTTAHFHCRLTHTAPLACALRHTRRRTACARAHAHAARAAHTAPTRAPTHPHAIFCLSASFCLYVLYRSRLSPCIPDRRLPFLCV